MNKDNIKIFFKELFQEIFPELKDKELDFAKKQDDFENWDSFTHMELVSKIEQKFEINLELEEVIELDTLQKFVDIVLKKKGF